MFSSSEFKTIINVWCLGCDRGSSVRSVTGYCLNDPDCIFVYEGIFLPTFHRIVHTVGASGYFT